MKKIGFFTTFFEAESGFSLIAVTMNQIQMLLDNQYDPVVLVQEGQYCEDESGHVLPPIPFKEVPLPSIWNKETLDLRPVIPAMRLTDDVSADFDDRVARIVSVLERELESVDVCITHDIILHKSCLEHNAAMRQYAKMRPDLLWLHWIHSCPTPGVADEYPENCRFTPPPGYIVYPNSSDTARVCATYGLQGQEWRVVTNRSGHAIDPLTIWAHDGLTRDLALSADLLSGDVVAVYPARLDRGKQPEKIIRLMHGVKELGYEPRLLVIAWQAFGKRFQDYIDELLVLAKRLDLENEVFFTNRLDDRCSQGVPRRTVLELMQLSNVYIHPSRIETYSLTVHEAIVSGNLVVLNYDLPVMRELFGDCGIYMDFGSDRVNRTYQPSEQAFWNDEAGRLVAEISQNRALRAKTKAMQEWTPRALWKEFVPLLYKTPVGT